MTSHVKGLSKLTGLDEATIKEQIVPYLESFTTQQTLINHLQDLLGPGAAQKALIADYARVRFPSAAAKSNLPSASTPLVAAPSDPEKVTAINDKGKASASSSSLASGKKTKSKFPSKLPPPRKVDANTFGGHGAVYRKGQDDEPLFSSATSTRTATPVDRINNDSYDSSSAAPSPVLSHTKPVERASTDDSPKIASSDTTRDKPALEHNLIPTAEMRVLQSTIALLRGESTDDPVPKAKPCFCQGRRHSVHPHVPLCLQCGLILCVILSPSPLLLPSPPCPSCAAPLLNTASRAILLMQLDMELATLTQAHMERVKLLREERERAWKEKRQERELFPDLQPQYQISSSSSSSSQAGSNRPHEYNAFYERRRAMDIAMGRKMEEDDQRRSRVLRIGPSQKKGAAGGKKSGKTKLGDSKAGQKSSISNATAATNTAREGSSLKQQQDQAEALDDEEEETGTILDYDYDEQGTGPMADADDDGFARHEVVFQPESAPVNDPSPTGWWSVSEMNSAIRYIPKEERKWEEDDAEEEEIVVPAPRQVPGAAREDLSRTTNGTGTGTDTGRGKKKKNDADNAS